MVEELKNVVRRKFDIRDVRDYNNVSKWSLIVGSLAGMIACMFLAQISTEIYMIGCILKIVIPVLFLTFSMGLCRTKVVGKLEETEVYIG